MDREKYDRALSPVSKISEPNGQTETTGSLHGQDILIEDDEPAFIEGSRERRGESLW
jgi:hypothetical protein